jgi:two-component system, LytTR family, response regulator
MIQEKIKTIIIDDEKSCRDSLRGLINDNCSNLELVSEASCINKGMQCIEEHHPGLVFLDVKLPDGTGFDMLDNLPSINFKIIFVSAFDRYAINAFRFSALDYLLKPVETEKLMRAVSKLYDSNHTASFNQRLDMLMSNLRGFNKIALPTLKGFTFVELQEIIRCESASNYTCFILKDGSKELISRSLKEYDELLSQQGFFRTHKSHLINLSHVVKYHKGEGGSIIMNDGSSVEVSRRKKEELLNILLRRKAY